MKKSSFQTSEKPKINLEISGNLSVKGWDESQVVVKYTSPDDFTVESQEDEIRITCESNCNLRIPYDSIVNAGKLDGDAVFKAVEGEISIDRVAGNLALRSVGQVNVGVANGNLTAKNVDGSLNLISCDGNVMVRDIKGDFLTQEDISGNLTLKEIDGNAKARANGNVTVNLDPSPVSTYEFQAEGNLTCRLPSDASVNVSITSGEKVKVKIPNVEVPSRITTPFDLVLGEGDASLTMSASGNVTLSSRPPDWNMGAFEVGIGDEYEHLADTLDEEISAQIDAQMEMMEEEMQIQFDNLSTSLDTTGLSPEEAERIAQRTRKATERANQRAQEKMRRAQEKMHRKLDAARRRAERRTRAAERAARDRRRRPESPTWSSSPARAVSEPVSEEERLMILQLLEQGKVTTEEAEQLLAALEGKSP
jgi:DUF4097 and DUF4098 domain-containing protein YvlB